MTDDFKDVIVKKPWGFEYLLYENDQVGVWFLHIEQGKKTSLHCHPNKKTGLILLSGEAVLSFLNSSTALKPLGKTMIREGLFHSTAAVSAQGATVIEVETPRDKTDLVRFDDEYGRQEKPYEGRDATSPRTEECLWLTEPREGAPALHSLAGCSLAMERVAGASGLRERSPGEVIVVLDGGLFSKGGGPVLAPGDVVGSDTLQRLSERFECPRGIGMLAIRRDQ